jgi:hypothetical protein
MQMRLPFVSEQSGKRKRTLLTYFLNSSASIPPFSLQPKVGSHHDPPIQGNLDGTVAVIYVQILFDSSFPVDLTWKWGGSAKPVAVLPNNGAAAQNQWQYSRTNPCK